MYRILLVDDEPIILSGLQSMLPWEEHQCVVVGAARNGRQAIEMIEQQWPNIVICDINMPILTGLELLEQTAKTHPEIVFIMLTNHSDFDMARQSLRHQAVDYLLKINLDEQMLGAAIERAIRECDKRRRLAKSQPHELELTPSDLILRYVGDLLSGGSVAVNEALKGLKEQKADAYCAMCELVLNLEQVPNIAEFSAEEKKRLLDFNHKLVEELAQKIFFHNGYVLSQLPSGNLLFFFWDLNSSKIFARFQSKLSDSLESISQVSVNLLVTEILSGDGIRDFRMQLASLHNEFSYAPRPVLHYARSMMRANYVEAAQRYLESHVLERVTVQDTAQAIGITPNYLSSLFKRQLGQNFVDYVNETKVRHACVLLKNPRMMVYEVSHMLGFDNAYYFSKVFKKYMGMPPSEYQSQFQ